MIGTAAISGHPVASFIANSNVLWTTNSDWFQIGIVGIGDVSRWYLVSSLTGENVLAARSTCQFTLSFHDGAAAQPVEILSGQDVHITNRDGHVFSGIVNRVERVAVATSTELQMRVSCVDFNFLADRRLVIGVFEGSTQTLRSIVNAIHAAYLVDEGVLLGEIEVGPTITHVTFSYQRVSRALDGLSDLTGQAFLWHIDRNKRLNVFSRETFAAPFSITDTSGKVTEIVESKAIDTYRNRQFITGGRDISDPRTEGFQGDGENRTFTLSLPVAEKPSISINTVPVAANNIGIKDVDDVDWLYQIGDEKVSKTTDDDLDSTPPLATDVIDITYTGFVPITVVLDRGGEILARQQIETDTSGVYEHVEDDDGIFEQGVARQKAEALLDQFTSTPSRVIYGTHRSGLEPGQLQSVTLDSMGLSGSYILERVSFSDRGDYRTFHEVEATEGSDILQDVAFFKSLIDAGRRFTFNENQKLLQPEDQVETIDFADTLTDSATDDTIDYTLDEYSIWFVGGSATLGHLVTLQGVPTVTGAAIGPPENFP